MTSYRRTALAVALSFISVIASGQAPEHSHGNRPPAEPVPSGSVSPELETFGRILAVQARIDQVGYFNSAIESTDRALHESRQLQHLGAAANDIAAVNAISLQLRDSLDDVEHYNGRLLASFSPAAKVRTEEADQADAQGVFRTWLTMHVRGTAAHGAGKDCSRHLATGAANLEKTLSDFRTDEIRLGREMGIQTK